MQRDDSSNNIISLDAERSIGRLVKLGVLEELPGGMSRLVEPDLGPEEIEDAAGARLAIALLGAGQFAG